MKITQPLTSLCIITFQKSFINFKSTQNTTFKCLGLDIKHSLHTCKCSFGYFHNHMLQNKQSNKYSLYSMKSVVVLFAYQIKLNVPTRKGVT